MFRLLATTNSSLARFLRRARSRFVSHHAPIVIGGSQRSGTTLMRVILDSHPQIACGPESSLLTGGFMPHKLAARFDCTEDEIWQWRERCRDHAEFVDVFLTEYANRCRKRRWAEKTPQNVHHVGFIFRHFPKARFIHLVRDGRDTVCSIRTHPKYRIVDGRQVATGIRRPLKPCIESWLAATADGLRWRGHPQYLEVRYEDIVNEPEPTLRRVCEFIGEDWTPALLEFHLQDEASRDPRKFVSNLAATQPLSRQAVQRWRKDLGEDEVALFHRLAGERMRVLGYAMGEPQSYTLAPRVFEEEDEDEGREQAQEGPDVLKHH